MAATSSRSADRGSKQKLAIIAASVVALVLVAAFAVRSLSDDDVNGRSAGATEQDDRGAAGDTPGTNPDGSNADGTAGSDSDGTGSGGATQTTLMTDPVLPPEVVPAAALPVKAGIADNTGLADGDVVTISIDAEKDSLIYAASARICEGGATIESDYDMRPSLGGKCVPFALSKQSDAYVDIHNGPPYQHMDLSIRVGTGTSTYTTQDGQAVSITCDHDHPCTLAVKFQIPNGYGFRTYPLEYR